MANRTSRFLTRLREDLRVVFYGPQALAFLSAVMLAAYWWGGEAMFIGIGILVHHRRPATRPFRHDGRAHLANRP